MNIVIDPGHGGKDIGVVGITGLREKECTLNIAKKCGQYLVEKGLSVKYTRVADEFLNTSERIKIANEDENMLFISIHINSVKDSSISGCEAYTLKKNSDGERLANDIVKSIINKLNLKLRGVKFANFTLLKDIKIPSVIIEVCYISNTNDEMLLRDEDFKTKVGEAIAKGVISYINEEEVKEEVSKNNFDIISSETAIAAQAMQWAKNKGATEKFIALANIYWSLSEKMGKVNPVIAYAQAAIETSYGKYNDKIDESYKNPCGLRKTDSSDDNKESYVTFQSWSSGISAHLDHLALYGGAEGYPKSNTTDPRHFSFLLGRAKTALELSGNWSPMRTYGESIVKLVEEINNTVVSDDFSNIASLEKKDDKEKKKDEKSYNKIKSVRGDIEELYDILVNLKKKVDSINKTMENIEDDIEQGTFQNEELINKNKILSQKISNYENTIVSVMDLLKEKKK